MRRKQLWVSLIATTVIAFGSLIAVIATSTHPQLGLDLQGGASVTLTPVGKFDSGALNEVTQIYRSRIDSLGVAEPEVRREGDTIVVDLPGVKNKQRAIDLIGTTGKVVFRPVIASQPVSPPLDLTKQATTGATTTTTPGATTTTTPGASTTAPAATATTARGSSDRHHGLAGTGLRRQLPPGERSEPDRPAHHLGRHRHHGRRGDHDDGGRTGHRRLDPHPTRPGSARLDGHPQQPRRHPGVPARAGLRPR